MTSLEDFMNEEPITPDSPGIPPLLEGSPDCRDVVREEIQEVIDRRGEMIYDISTDRFGSQLHLTSAELARCRTNLFAICDENGWICEFLREFDSRDGDVSNEFIIRKNYAGQPEFIEVRIAALGNVDAGKSSTIGTLCSNQLDDGRGARRAELCRHPHESESGRTSSIGYDNLGLDAGGRLVNIERRGTKDRRRELDEICRACSKMICFVDLCGHTKYYSTTLQGLMSSNVGYCMLVIGANQGVIGMMKEHLGSALCLKLPIFVVVTKIDMTPPEVVKRTMRTLYKLLKSPNIKRVPFRIRGVDDVLTAIGSIDGGLVPVFKTSNVTGHGLDELRLFMNLLPGAPGFQVASEDEPEPGASLAIHEDYSVPGIGTVVHGLCRRGVLRAGAKMLIGPDSLGHYKQTRIRSIQLKRADVDVVGAGHMCTLALPGISRDWISRGMIVVDPAIAETPIWEFLAEILILYHSSTIKEGYEAVMHCDNVQQMVKLIECDEPVLRSGSRAKVRMRFRFRAEVIATGARALFRDGRTKIVGRILETYNNK